MAKHRELGLTDAEFDLILEKMGREPNGVELAMFSLLWSEHCAYKHSKKLLGKLPTDGPRVVMGPGENAGAVDIGSGWSIAFKVESHNHPSAVEPFQGAATGVGGILRDVIALGARPIAILDSLRFGELDSERTRYLVDGVVRGIGHYGNSMGIPTVGGEIYFEAPYEQNCLVNAMCVGIARTDEMVRAAAEGTGNQVVLFGSKTGRDGIGGASVLASAEFGEDDEGKRPTVQIGDPFEESKVLECCQELLAADLLVSLQDLGAAGLTSSAGEMASAGGTGIDIDVGKVPLREADMEPFEIMVSESQERMLAVVEPGKVEEVLALCTKWQTDSAVIGEVTDTGSFRILKNGETVGDIAVEDLVDGCPLYDLEPDEPAEWIYPNYVTLREGADASEITLSLLGSSSIASKRWAYDQYDSVVGSRTVHRAGAADAAVLNIPESDRAIAIAIDGNGRRVACSPRLGTIEATLECAANLACVGAEPLGVTNCLNFGNPEKPTVAWQLSQSIDGLADACRALELPVVGGNVSLYNETPTGPIYPTPVIGMVGELPDPETCAGEPWRDGDWIALAGPFNPSLAGSELEKARGQLGKGLPEVEIEPARAAIELIRESVRAGTIRTVTDVSDGGVATVLSELALGSGVGCKVTLDPVIVQRDCSEEDALFGEGSGGFILAGDRQSIELLGGQGVQIEMLGRAQGNEIRIQAGDTAVDILVAEAKASFESLAHRIEL
ncbi:MAG: phosphoribosylformylglycinamidine synthase subunit PurL [Thermoleophilia bacterium]|nr:phosphoribosylformylglycinamidine synthase subunit PurL [Thermoleophilia bacterium]